MKSKYSLPIITQWNARRWIHMPCYIIRMEIENKYKELLLSVRNVYFWNRYTKYRFIILC